MTDNCIQNDVKAYDPRGKSTVLIADPEGKLKLVKWRLKRDGFCVLYTEDMAAVKELMGQNNVRIVIVNVSKSRDLKKLSTVYSIKGDFKVIVFTSGHNIGLKKRMFALGVRKIFSKPIDFPVLSLIVREEIDKPVQDRPSENTLCERRGTAPLGLLKAYKTVLDHVKTAVLITDLQGVIVCVNRPMTLLLQMNEAYILNKHYQKVMDQIPGTYHYEFLRVLQKTMLTLKVHNSMEVVGNNGNDDLLPVEAEAYPIFDNKGKFIGSFLIVGEILGSGNLERVAAQSEKLAIVGQLAAGAVHEIKNPLTSVRGFIQLLQKEAKESPKAEYYNIIIDEIDRVNNIVNEFLRLAKPTLPNRKTSDLKELWGDIRVLMEGKAFLLNINIKEDLSEHLKPVLIDCEQIKQVVINVVMNSFEAMPGGGDLTVRLYEIERDKAICLEISDTGEGMEEETARRIFVPFFTTKDNGTGLGLAVSLTIMENHGGHIEVKSKAGYGTTTLIYFPSE